MHPIVNQCNSAVRRLPLFPFYALLLAPIPVYFWLAVNGNLGAEPVQRLEHVYGLFGLQFLIASLCVTPMLRIFRLNLIRFRRMLGLTAFYYVLAHLAIYAWLDRELNWALVAEDLTKRPYIILGFIGFVAMLPAALTSTDWAVRRLDAVTWRRLHRLVYLAVLAASAHFLWLVKAWPLEPILYFLASILLLAWRAYPVGAMPRRSKRRVAANPS